MATVKIKTKTGTIIIIKGTETEVARIASYFEDTTATAKDRGKGLVLKDRDKQKMKKRRRTASDLVMELREEGYFDEPKTLAETANILREKGYIYPMTTLSGLMLDFVKGKLLGRAKIDKKWKYGK